MARSWIAVVTFGLVAQACVAGEQELKPLPEDAQKMAKAFNLKACRLQLFRLVSNDPAVATAKKGEPKSGENALKYEYLGPGEFKDEALLVLVPVKEGRLFFDAVVKFAGPLDTKDRTGVVKWTVGTANYKPGTGPVYLVVTHVDPDPKAGMTGVCSNFLPVPFLLKE